MTSRSPDGIYSPLDKESHEIRLLEIDPISNGSYQLRVVSLRDGPPPIFAALSYVWGDPLPTAELVVNGQKVTVRSSLAGALANASSSWETWSAKFPERCLGTCRLWADALCIDQENTDEKNHQVSQMAEVYRKAELVICWLGPSNDQIFLAMDSIQIIAQEASTSDQTTEWGRVAEDLRSYVPQSFHSSNTVFINDLHQPSDHLVPADISPTSELQWLEKYPFLWQETDRNSPSSRNEVWSAINSMMGLSYWTRVWIFQEVVLGRHCLLACGQRSISLDQVISATLWAVQLHKGLSGYGRPGFIPSLDWLRLTVDTSGTWSAVHKILIARSLTWNLLAMSSELMADRVADAMDSTQLDKTLSVLRAEEKCWRELSWIGGSFRATNPKDYVYGVLGVTGVKLYPDYSDSKSVGDVCYDYFNEWLRWLQKRQDFERHLGPVPDALWFLQHSGIGRLFEKPLSDHPSWIPNIPCVMDNDSGFIDQSWVQSPGADFGIFDSMPESFQILGSRLVTPAVLVDRIAKTGPEHAHLPGKSTLPWLYDFITSRESYVTGCHPILAVLALIHGNQASKQGSSSPAVQDLGILLRSFFRSVFQRRQRKSSAESSSIEEGLGEAPSSIIRCLREIRFGELLGDLGQAKELLALNGVVIADVGDIGTNEGRQAIAEAVKEVALKIGNELIRLDLRADSQLESLLRQNNLRLAETEGGYLGFFPRGIEEGDVVCVLKGAHLPSVLRRVELGSHFLHVGTCFVHGLMRGEAGDFTLSERYQREVVDIF